MTELTKLGNINLFSCHLIIGCESTYNKQIKSIQRLNKWLDFKDKNFYRKEYNIEGTQYIHILHIIDLQQFKEILNDLVIIYKKDIKNLYAEKLDFINDVFYYTLTDLNKFIESWNFIFYQQPPRMAYDIYYNDEICKSKIVDFMVLRKFEINTYKQYYKKIIELINNVDYENINAESDLILNQQTEIKTEHNLPLFINNLDNVKPIEVYNHFKNGLVEKEYLTEQELIEFLKAAFESKTIPVTLFKIKDAPNKTIIIAVFYTYYKNVACKIHGKQKQYAALLGDYFEGFNTATVSSNFSKSVY